MHDILLTTMLIFRFIVGANFKISYLPILTIIESYQPWPEK